MADHQHSDESLMDKVSGKLHKRSTSSSSSSDDEKPPVSHQPIKPVNRPVGGKKSVHNCLGGRKAADLFLWRDKKRSASILAGATVLWILFECMEYHFLTFVCHVLILSCAILFIWINSAAFLKRSLLKKIASYGFERHYDDVHEFELRDILLNSFADALRAAFVAYMKTFFLAVVVICVIAVFGSCCSCLLPVIGRRCRCLLTIFSFMMISYLRQGAVNIMASEFYGAFADLREAVTGRDLKKFVLVVAVIWVIAFMGSCSSFLTIFSFMIISSVVLLKRSLRQKVVNYKHEVKHELNNRCSEFRRHLLRRPGRHLLRRPGRHLLRRPGHLSSWAEFTTILNRKTSAMNRFADRRRAAFVTYMKTSNLVVVSLWLLFVIGSSRDFLTLALMLVVAHTVLFLYEKYQDQIDSFAHKVSLKAKE